MTSNQDAGGVYVSRPQGESGFAPSLVTNRAPDHPDEVAAQQRAPLDDALHHIDAAGEALVRGAGEFGDALRETVVSLSAARRALTEIIASPAPAAPAASPAADEKPKRKPRSPKAAPESAGASDDATHPGTA